MGSAADLKEIDQGFVSGRCVYAILMAISALLSTYSVFWPRQGTVFAFQPRVCFHHVCMWTRLASSIRNTSVAH